MRVHDLRRELWLPAPLEEVFEFFSDPGNLAKITPPRMHFRMTTPTPIQMCAGLFLDYQLKVFGVPIKWRSEITEWEPPFRFVDEQREGPYQLWHHEHEFLAKNGGTLALDHVRYAVPFDFIAHRLLVLPDLNRIFDFRRQKLQERFPSRA
jgi:hypothetical protein